MRFSFLLLEINVHYLFPFCFSFVPEKKHISEKRAIVLLQVDLHSLFSILISCFLWSFVFPFPFSIRLLWEGFWWERDAKVKRVKRKLIETPPPFLINLVFSILSSLAFKIVFFCHFPQLPFTSFIFLDMKKSTMSQQFMARMWCWKLMEMSSDWEEHQNQRLFFKEFQLNLFDDLLPDLAILVGGIFIFSPLFWSKICRGDFGNIWGDFPFLFFIYSPVTQKFFDF